MTAPHIAYQTVGEGPIDIAWQVEFGGNLDVWWELPWVGRWFEGLASLGRLILHDPRGVGLSSRNVALPNLETRTDDLRAVLDEVGSASAVIGCWFEGLAPGVLLAAGDPARRAGTGLVESASANGVGAGLSLGRGSGGSGSSNEAPQWVGNPAVTASLGQTTWSR